MKHSISGRYPKGCAGTNLLPSPCRYFLNIVLRSEALALKSASRGRAPRLQRDAHSRDNMMVSCSYSPDESWNLQVVCRARGQVEATSSVQLVLWLGWWHPTLKGWMHPCISSGASLRQLFKWVSIMSQVRCTCSQSSTVRIHCPRTSLHRKP